MFTGSMFLQDCSQILLKYVAIAYPANHKSQANLPILTTNYQ